MSFVQALRNVISTLDANGREAMGPGILLYHYPDPNILNGSLITVESNHYCVLKSRGAILNVYGTGQHQLETPDKPLFGSIQKAFYGGQSPWQYEAIYVNRAKSVVRARGTALSREMAELNYEVDYYVHVETEEEAVNLYAAPVVEQAVNQIVQLTPLEQVNEKITDIGDLVRSHLQEFLAIYGITLNDVKVLIAPRDERMRELLSLRAFGMTEQEALRAYLALKLADRGLPTAVNALVGQPLQIALLPAGVLGDLSQIGFGNGVTGAR
jgi:membrane protease subunit (stomatin/prohibitin family)